jgi:hypothetical protein
MRAHAGKGGSMKLPRPVNAEVARLLEKRRISTRLDERTSHA